MRTAKNLLYHTWIGLRVKVVRSSARQLEGMEGRIVDETKNLIVMERGEKEVRIPKVACRFRFFLEDGSHTDVDGSKIAFRPEERAKKV